MRTSVDKGKTYWNCMPTTIGESLTDVKLSCWVLDIVVELLISDWVSTPLALHFLGIIKFVLLQVAIEIRIKSVQQGFRSKGETKS